MMDFTPKVFTIVTVAAAAVIAACSSSSPGNGGSALTPIDDGGSESSDFDSAPRVVRREAGASVEAGNPDTDCASKKGDAGSECRMCCSDAYPTANGVENKAFLGCACKADACQLACSDTACATPPRPPESDGGAACKTCLMGLFSPDAGGGCMQEVEKACLADKECGAYAKCTKTCGAP